MSRGFTPRNAQMVGGSGFAVQFHAETPWPVAQLSYPLVGHSAWTLTRTLHLLCCWEEIQGTQATPLAICWPDMWRMQLLLAEWSSWSRTMLYSLRQKYQFYWAANKVKSTSIPLITIPVPTYFNNSLKQPLGMTSILVLLPHWSSVSHGSCFYFFQNFHIFTNIFNQHFYETRRNPKKLFVYLKDDWMFSQHSATCWWHWPSVG